MVSVSLVIAEAPPAGLNSIFPSSLLCNKDHPTDRDWLHRTTQDWRVATQFYYREEEDLVGGERNEERQARNHSLVSGGVPVQSVVQ